MKGFIEARTRTNERKIFISIDKIVSISNSDSGGTELFTTTADSPYYLSESVEEILLQINKKENKNGRNGNL